MFDMCPLSFLSSKSLISKTFAKRLISIMKTVAATLRSFNAALRLLREPVADLSRNFPRRATPRIMMMLHPHPLYICDELGLEIQPVITPGEPLLSDAAAAAGMSPICTLA